MSAPRLRWVVFWQGRVQHTRTFHQTLITDCGRRFGQYHADSYEQKQDDLPVCKTCLSLTGEK